MQPRWRQLELRTGPVLPKPKLMFPAEAIPICERGSLMAVVDLRADADAQLVAMVRSMRGPVPPVVLELADRLEDRSARLTAALEAVGTDALVSILDGSAPMETDAGVAQRLASYANSCVTDPRIRELLNSLAAQMLQPAQVSLPPAA